MSFIWKEKDFYIFRIEETTRKFALTNRYNARNSTVRKRDQWTKSSNTFVWSTITISSMRTETSSTGTYAVTTPTWSWALRGNGLRQWWKLRKTNRELELSISFWKFWEPNTEVSEYNLGIQYSFVFFENFFSSVAHVVLVFGWSK